MRKSRLLGFASAFLLMPAFACAVSGEEADAPLVGDFPRTPDSTLEAGAASDAPDDVPMASLKGCSDDGFCYVPVPRSQPLIAVSGSGADDAWMLPLASDALFRWDGTSIKQVYEYDGADPPSITFVGIWAQTHDNVWAVAKGSDSRIALVRYASPPAGGSPTFRSLATEQPATSSIAQWGTPAADTLWISTGTSVVRVHEDTSGAVVEDLSPASGEDDSRDYLWHEIWGFASNDVYVGGKVCPSKPCGSESEGAIAHWDGTAWSVATIDSSNEVVSLRGTPPGGSRQLWYVATNRVPASSQVVSRTELVSLDNNGMPGAPIYSLAEDRAPACSARIGQATGTSSGWFSGGLLLCHWSGTKLEAVRTAVDGRVIVDTLDGIWADGSDAWIVGSAITRPGFPQAGFAARWISPIADGGTP